MPLKLFTSWSVLSRQIQCDYSLNNEDFEEFLSKTPKDEDDVKITLQSPLESFYGVQFFPSSVFSQIKHLFFSRTYKSNLLYTMADDYSELHICMEHSYDLAFMELFLAGFYSYMALHDQTLLLHASAIEHHGRAIAFTAPSGTGKTTQAELWKKYRGAEILNGDKVFVKQEEDAIHAWGSPWKGSSSYALNTSAPLDAIIVLEQAPENRIRKLDTIEAMQRFVPHVFFPSWDQACEQAVMEFLNKVMSEVDIYLLQCRPDEEAVAITGQAVWGE